MGDIFRVSKLYFYETHLHTVEASACARCPGADYPALYKELGYAGFFVTDHFFNGNSGVPRDLPWEERIDMYCSGYEHAREAGEKIGIDVFFGLEVNFQGDEYLLYGPDKEWLKAHPDIMVWSHEELRKQVHAIGGAMIQAHPYRDRDYLTAIRMHPHHSDAFEGYNAGNRDYSDQYAYAYASQNGIKMTSGSDIHRITDFERTRPGGTAFATKITSSKDYASRILQAARSIPVFGSEDGSHVLKDYNLTADEYAFVTYDDRIHPDKDQQFTKPFVITDENGVERPATPASTIDWSRE